MDKRTFLKSASLLGLGSLAAIPALARMVPAAPVPFPALSSDPLWDAVRADYDLVPDYINLENGYYCIQPRPVLEAYKRHIADVNRQGARYMRTVQAEDKQKAVASLAAIMDCDPHNLAITRNTTESLDLIISGFPWKAGDEAVMAHQDYGAMLDMFKQVARRHGVVNKVISVPANPQTDEEVVEAYAKAITPKTRLLMVCHMINITGQILPVQKICEMAHQKGVQVMVDGAHAFAHVRFSVTELGCDYYGASLHKWLSVPLGAGLLYVKDEHIPNIWPLFAEEGKDKSDILRLNHTGTHPVATDLTIADAISFYNRIGPERKEDRLRQLQQYWVTRVKPLQHLVLNSPEQSSRVCAIGNVGVKGMKPAGLADVLFNKYKIYTVAIDNADAGVHGVRITPNIYTTFAELDVLVKALGEIRG